MRRIREGLIVALTFLMITGCHAKDDKADAQVRYAMVRDNFLAQNAYSFYGRTKLVTGTTTNSNLVNYSGVVQDKDVYLDVRHSYPEEKRITTMSLLAKGPQLFSKMSSSAAWSPVHDGDFSIRQEFENWNPILNVQQMDQMRAQVLPLRDPNTRDSLKAVRVLLDSNKMKEWLRSQVRHPQTMSTQTVHMPKLKAAFSISDLPKHSGAAQIQSDASKNSLDNMIDNMKLEAEYTIYYDRKQLLPTQMTMAIRSQYVYHNQNIVEHSEIETFLRNYGKPTILPAP
ncbi:hypothetical protein ACQCN2_20110 [Brevibacillus ginsengisoli]|uniref:hypothetical protein n=1 Tax=Brevibacillus ginsengisoli TaxID=363854 RepID=UPI003CED264F